MATERAAFERFIPNSPRKLSVPLAERLMVMRPFRYVRDFSRRAAFEQVARRVLADVRREGGRIELLVRAEHDLDLLDRAAITDQPVVDPASHQPASELRQRPLERAAVADLRGPMLEGDDVLGQLLEAGHLERGTVADGDLHRAREMGLRRGCVRAGSGYELLDQGRRRPSPTRTTVLVNIAWPGEPTAQRTTIGRSMTASAGTSTSTPWLQSARASCANLSSAAMAAASVKPSRTDSRSSSSERTTTPPRASSAAPPS